MSDYTPTTAEVRDGYAATVSENYDAPFELAGEQFDRWLDARNAGTGRALARQIAQSEPDEERWQESVAEYHGIGWEGPVTDYDRMFWDAGYRAGRDHAARIARGAIQ